MKYETHSQYDSGGVAFAESALLTVWAGLGSWHEDLVLVGGLVPKYLCGDVTSPRSLPRPVTLDADLGIVVHGVDLQGARQNLTARVCDAGPFLVMKRAAWAMCR